ncbi:MAG TPA: DUF2101 domain-containing protein [Euryarchaeota archaeon]|nr:DUF2101 domain-containing protein [Euryarchaeota archaeon]
MQKLEKIGKYTLNTLDRIYYHIVGVIIKIILLFRMLGTFERKKILPIFERRGVSIKDYTILKLQISSLIFFLVIAASAFGFLSYSKALVLSVISGSYSLYAIFTQLKINFGKDYHAYRDFFLGYLAISILILIFSRLSGVEGHRRYIYTMLFSLIIAVAFSVFFKKRYGRNYTYSKVLEAGNVAIVKSSYDLLSGVKPGLFPVVNTAKAKKGDRVKVRVESGLLNLRGSKPVEILEVAKKG